jgi:GNAT superfamily N-acetyltransferase
MMPYGKRYYPEFLSRLGYAKARDLLAYDYQYPGEIPEHMVRFSKRTEGRLRVSVRAIDMARFDEEVRSAFSVYNKAWAANWGFVPMTPAQFDHMARTLKQIVDPDLVLIAQIDGEPVGFSLSLPDYNGLLKKMGGRLFPFGIFTFLRGRHKIANLRTLTLGVVPEHRKKGIEILLIYHTFRNGLPKGYRRAELSWVLEDNVLFRRTAERMGARPYKTYRIYEKAL